MPWCRVSSCLRSSTSPNGAGHKTGAFASVSRHESSTVPTMHGESVVLRLLDHGGRPVTLEELGMNPGVLRSVEHLSQRPHGMFLVTGPTGSGKTTKLYAALQRRDSATEKIITVEDP